MYWLLPIVAALLQTARNVFARKITHEVSPWTNSWARFGLALPWCCLAVLVLVESPLAVVTNTNFCFLVLAASLTHTLGNAALVAAFRTNSFSESVSLYKLDVAAAALIGFSAFKELPSASGWTGILLCTFGILATNATRPSKLPSWQRYISFNRGALYALMTAGFFAFAGFAVKAAVSALRAQNPSMSVLSATIYMLMWTLILQTIFLSIAVILTERNFQSLIKKHLGATIMLGATSFTASAFWFWSYSVMLVSYSRALGTIEIICSAMLSIFVFKEAAAIRQLPAALITAVGLLLIVFAD